MESGKVTAMSHEGRGIIRKEGEKTIFVDYALEGEEAEYEVYRERSKFKEAKATKILKPSPKRVTPPCPYFTKCGGCALQHLDHSAQIKLKENILLNHLEHIASVKPEKIIPPLTGPVWHYRNRARLSVYYDKKAGRSIVGFLQNNPHTIIEIQKCKILSERVTHEELSDFINILETKQSINIVDISVGEEATAILLRFESTPSELDVQKIKTFGQSNNLEMFGLIKDQLTQYSPEESKLYYTVEGLKLKFSPLDFTQINPDMNQKMIQQAIELLEINSHDSVLDLYCGLGNFSLPVALKAQLVTGIEGSKAMVKRAQDNAAFNKITNTSFYAANLSKSKITWPSNKFTKLILDPPRAGANIDLVSKLNIPTILYVSCNSITLARDAKKLGELGYTAKAAGIMDMFPHTKHVESMVLFQK